MTVPTSFKNLTSNGYTWYASESDGSQMFMKTVGTPGNPRYLDMRCTPEDLTNGNFEFFAKHGLTNTNKTKVKK